MDHLLAEGLLGIVTGILTTVILFSVRALWTGTLYPMIEALRYSGLKVDGAWEGGHVDASSRSESRLTLKQKAHRLNGAFTFKYLGPDKEFTLDFDVQGVIWEGFITLNFSPSDRRITSCATTLVKVKGGGSVMGGGFLFRNAETDDVGVVQFHLQRYDRVAGFNAHGNATPRAVELAATQASVEEVVAQPATGSDGNAQASNATADQKAVVGVDQTSEGR
ncbi:hypothetical protein [Burkholderia ubonensis]|uniref:hypothetical protein n=1 Tax=Burkholderia ubonensis TaxID=101571 RepID=UPI000A4DEE58|nr:hypothetical protein [Burkholderia ubonensis]